MTVKRFTHFPREYKLAPQALRDLAERYEEADFAVKRSRRAWVVYGNGEPLFMLGVWRLSLLGAGTRVWFIPFLVFLTYIRDSYRLLRRNIDRLKKACGGLSVLVDADMPRYKNFSRHLGFVPNGQITWVDNRRFAWYFLR